MTPNSAPSALDFATLLRRLHDLAGDERRVQVDFLLHLDEVDGRRAYLQAGFGSLWDFCLKALHLREGAAGRRIAAMRVLRRFPRLESALRNGKLCLSTIALLGPVLTDENVDELVARAAYRTKVDVDHLVASIQPRLAPANGIRKLRDRIAASAEIGTTTEASRESPSSGVTHALLEATAPATPLALDGGALRSPRAVPAPERAKTSVDLRPVSRDAWSLRVTMDAGCKADLETLALLLSHKTGRDLAAVLHEAIRCGIEKHGKRKGAVMPPRARASVQRNASGPANARAIPAAVRREVWTRDGGCCTWSGDDGRRCGSTWKLELDHVVAVARGGASEPDNLRLLCRAHNVLHAERTYGREQMARYSRHDRYAGRPNATAQPLDSPDCAPLW